LKLGIWIQRHVFMLISIKTGCYLLVRTDSKGQNQKSAKMIFFIKKLFRLEWCVGEECYHWKNINNWQWQNTTSKSDIKLHQVIRGGLWCLMPLLGFKFTLVVIGYDYIGSCKCYYNTNMTTLR